MRGTRRYILKVVSLFALSVLISVVMIRGGRGIYAFSNAPNPAATAGGDNATTAKIWVGLSNRGTARARLDLRVTVFANGALVNAGQLTNVGAGRGGFGNATLHTIPLSPGSIPTGTELAFEAFARQTCATSDYSSGTVRLWYGGPPVDSKANPDAGSRVEVIVDTVTDEYFLREGRVLSADPGSGRTFVDVSLDSKVACPGRPFTSFGTWRILLP